MKKLFSGRIVTLPNLLSLFRLCLVPGLMLQYPRPDGSKRVLILLLISALTDVLDGWTARRFGMVSDLGKALDPVADKLTQASMLFCLARRFPLMLLPLTLLVIKESCCAALSLSAIGRTGQVDGADWHGKLNTALLYTLFALHLIMPDIAPTLSDTLIFLSSGVMLLSFVLYFRRLSISRADDRR